jgi:TFIIF-interacting CTD phosphatase-like protein
MSEKPLVILDLDGTLIWATSLPTKPILENADFTIQVYGETLSVQKRPGLDAFIEWCRQHFRLAVWTAAQPAYAYAIAETIFKGIELEFIFTRPHTMVQTFDFGREIIYRKPLLKVWALPFRWFHHQNTRIVDDTPETYAFNPENAIPIATWMDGANDVELLRVQLQLEDWLEKLYLGQESF